MREELALVSHIKYYLIFFLCAIIPGKRTSRMPLIELKHISKFYTDGVTSSKGLDDISLSFEKGEYVAITGEEHFGFYERRNFKGEEGLHLLRLPGLQPDPFSLRLRQRRHRPSKQRL